MSADYILKLMKGAVTLNKPDCSKWCDQLRDVLPLLDVAEYIDDSIPQLKTQSLKNASAEDLDFHKKDQNFRVAISRDLIHTLYYTQRPPDFSKKKWIVYHFQKCCNGFFMSIIIPLKDPEVTLTKTLNTIRSSQANYRELQPTPVIALTKADKFSANISNHMSFSHPSSLAVNERRSCAFCHKENHKYNKYYLLT
ncbi:hypothetical protein GcM3_012019 [Golovinomyces cichoracearum]|uniref:Uncharacterized protein n=1 Tax=Golovinomyces cichoracearum TaxID=62708 RepID=A0A420J9Q7_9PEZI|nr:hypothetical protein GcM3_012019 [Golovinomyces cichoracearum]